MLYADASALARAYIADEAEHEQLRPLILEGAEPVVTSELARLELTSAVVAAERAGRIREAADLLNRIEIDCGEGGPIFLLRLDLEVVFPAAHRLLLAHRLRTLDAIHLAVALEQAPAFAGEEEIILVTRDERQATAARALGLTVR